MWEATSDWTECRSGQSRSHIPAAGSCCSIVSAYREGCRGQRVPVPGSGPFGLAPALRFSPVAARCRRSPCAAPPGRAVLQPCLYLGALFLGDSGLFSGRAELTRPYSLSPKGQEIDPHTDVQHSSFFQAGAEVTALLQIQAFCHTGILLFALWWPYHSHNRQL